MNIKPTIYDTLPKNLYHITTTDKFMKIKQDKLLKAMPDTLTNGMVKGIFVFDLENFVQKWTKSKPMNFARLILDYIGKDKKIIMLRIPVKKLPEDVVNNIRTRDVDKAIDWRFSGSQYRGKSSEGVVGYKYTEAKHKTLLNGAVEHIVPSDVNLEKIECLGMSSYDSNRSIADILTDFFKNQPEEKFIKDNIDTLI